MRSEDEKTIEALAAGLGVETQKSIETWRLETFGPFLSAMRMGARANEEMAELLRALSTGDPNAANEIADVVIVLYGVASKLGVDLHDEVDRKMNINRARTWNVDSTGHGYHVRDKAVTP